MVEVFLVNSLPIEDLILEGERKVVKGNLNNGVCTEAIPEDPHRPVFV